MAKRINTETIMKVVSEKKEILYGTAEGAEVKASFYWDDGIGNEIPWEYNGKKSYSKNFKQVVIMSNKQRMRWCSDGKEWDSESWEVYGDGKKLDLGEVVGYNINGKTIKLKCCVGAG